MNLEAALHDLAEAVAAGQAARTRDGRLRVARQLVVDRCVEALGAKMSGAPSVAPIIRLAAETADRVARRACAVLLVHALAMPGLVPASSGCDVCALMEKALRDVLLRCGYPFCGSIDERMRVLERLHLSIGELMQPLEPTFPNWQGLYAG